MKSILITLILLHSMSAMAAESMSSFNECDCGYTDVLTHNNWASMWHINFDKSNLVGNRLFTSQDLFFANYKVNAKHNDSYARIFEKNNLAVVDDALQIAITINDTTLDIKNNEDERIKCAGVGTTRQDFLYGSFRSYMKLSNVEGSVAGMFIYHPEGEIDIEVISSIHPSEAYFTVHPKEVEGGKASSLTHGTQLFNYVPSDEYHEYRFDWLPGRVIYYIDGIEAYQITTNVLSLPGRLMFNHWTDGNENFSQGPIKQNSYMYIKNITVFFNYTDHTHPEGLSTPMCTNQQDTCLIQNILQPITPYKEQNAASNRWTNSSGDMIYTLLTLLVLVLIRNQK